jgi:thiol-disulfide isomerase/thioredoxin
MSRKGRRSGAKRSYTPWIILTLVVITGLVGYYIFTQSGAGAGSSLDGTLVPSTVLNDLSGVSASTLNQVGSGATGVNSPTSISGPALTLNGKPEVLYMGAEYCPYCAAERWAMIVALDKFGNFTGIQYMQSSSTDIYSNTPTFTFVGATYTSSYISFVTVEQLDRNSNPLQTATAAETSLLNSYDSGGTIPFVDFANQYVITSAQFLPNVLRTGNSPSGTPLNWTQVAPHLNDSSSVYAMNIDGAANRIISAICKIDGGTPSSVCSQSFASTLSYIKPSSSGSSQLLVSDAVLRGPTPSVEAARFGPTRLTDWV